MEFYNVIYEIYNNNTKVGEQWGKDLTDNPTEKEIKINWENLRDIYKTYGGILPFNYWNFKRGRLISFFNCKVSDKNTWDIKEWKTPELNIILKIKYKKRNSNYISLNEILNWHDHEKAMIYLKEKNIKLGLDK